MNSRKVFWLSWVLSAIPGLFLLSSGVNVARQADFVMESFRTLGFPEAAAPAVGIVEFICIALYLIPRTAVMGAILVTGYLGGAVATHVRVSDPTMFAPILMGVLVWAGLYLRNAPLRALVPFVSSK